MRCAVGEAVCAERKAALDGNGGEISRFENKGCCAIIYIRVCNCENQKGYDGYMVNEERLHHMIKLAQFDEKDGKACKPMTQYARKDYVSLQILLSFVTGTICYGLLFGLRALYSLDSLFELLNQMEVREILLALVLSYLAFMVVYLGATYLVFHIKYTEGRRKVKKYYTSLKKVNQIYEREERLKTNGRTDWE